MDNMEDRDLRVTALTHANVPGLETEAIVARAKEFYRFLKKGGEDDLSDV